MSKQRTQKASLGIMAGVGALMISAAALWLVWRGMLQVPPNTARA